MTSDGSIIVRLITQQMKTHNDLKSYLGHVKNPDRLSHDSAVGLFTLPNLHSLELELVHFNEAFYGGMATSAPHAQVCVCIHLTSFHHIYNDVFLCN